MRRKIFNNKFIPLILLFVIVSHLFIFHFVLKTEFLSVGEKNHLHVENISDSFFVNNLGLNSVELSIRNTNNCTNLFLDKHVDENFSKVRRIIQQINVEIINLKFLHCTPTLFSKKNYDSENRQEKLISEHLPTTILII